MPITVQNGVPFPFDNETQSPEAMGQTWAGSLLETDPEQLTKIIGAILLSARLSRTPSGNTPMVLVVQTRKLRSHLRNGLAPSGVPPFGANRLHFPQPIAPWDGVRSALASVSKSLQPPYPPGAAKALQELVSMGEDYLALNVWTPDLGAAARPLMIRRPDWTFEFYVAAAPFCDGSRFTRDGDLYEPDPVSCQVLSDPETSFPHPNAAEG